MRSICFTMVAMVVVAFGVSAWAEEVDVRALRARLAAQEALLDDLEAKANYKGMANANYGGNPEALVSLNKNALVSVGGELNTRYFYHSGKIDSIYDYGTTINPTHGTYRRRAEISQSDLTITDAKLYVDVQVNDYFDAFLQVDLQSSNDNASDNAEKYYVRWKNICNSGFGIKVGRDALVFGEDFGVGILADYCQGGDGVFANAYYGMAGNLWFYNVGGGGGFAVYPLQPYHNYWDQGRITQITPYWEFCDGKFSAEFSVFQDSSNSDSRMSSRNGDNTYIEGMKYKSRNYGTSVSGRLRWKPIEGLTLSASAVNFYDSTKDDNSVDVARKNRRTKNNTAVDLAFNYRPCFLPALQVWGQYIHGWNVGGAKDHDAYTISYGASYDFCENWTVFASGDWLAFKNTYQAENDKATAWAVYGGLRYTLPYGVDIEAGWKHEEIKWRQNAVRNNATNQFERGGERRTTAKAKGDTAYVHVGFTF